MADNAKAKAMLDHPGEVTKWPFEWLGYMRPDELIRRVPDMTLLSVVMKLTNGTANPAIVLAQIAAHKCAKSAPDTACTDLQRTDEDVTPQREPL
jgi:hypothetical protein